MQGFCLILIRNKEGVVSLYLHSLDPTQRTKSKRSSVGSNYYLYNWQAVTKEGDIFIE